MIDDHVFAASHLDREIASGKKEPTSFFFSTDQHDDVLGMYLVEQEEEDVHMFKATKINLSLPESIKYENVISVEPARGLFAVCYFGPYGTEARNILYDVICNPFTGQFFRLPLILSQDLQNGRISVGFGFDPSTCECKLLRMFYSWDTPTEVLIFKLGSKSWKKLENVPIGKWPCSGSVSVDNMLHWFLKDVGFLETFDLTSETFGCIQLPEGRKSPDPGYLYNLDGCLSIADNSTVNDCIEVWVMKDYGVTESWTRFVVSRESFGIGDNVVWLQPVSFLNNIELLLLCNGDTLVVHNTESGTRSPVHISGLPGCPRFEAYSYGGNLLSLRSAE